MARSGHIKAQLTTAMAQLRKDQHLVAQHSDSVILADFGALAAVRAPSLIHLWIRTPTS
jgi:hypothetical protein